MSFTTDDIISRAKNKLGLSSSTSSDLNSTFLEWIDDARAYLDSELSLLGMGWKETTTDIDTVANQDAYELPSPFYHLDVVHFKIGDVYYPLEYDQAIIKQGYNTTSPNSNVIKWAIRGNYIVLRGVPDTAVTAGLRITAYPNTDDYESGDTISDEVNLVRLIFVLYLCKTYRESGDSKSTNIFAGEFDKVFGNYIAVMQKFKANKQLRIM